jgi:enoyl-CoA hydratase/carnithine racemase
MTTRESLIESQNGDIAILTLNRPEARNALNDDLREELRAALASRSENPAIRAVVLTGAGGAFCAGGDIQGMKDRLEAPPGEIAFNGWRRQQKTFGLIAELHRIPQVTIAAVEGPAVGLGFDLALACDFIVADHRALFAASFVNRGLISDGGGMYFLPRRIGLQRAKEILFSGRRVPAEEACALGIVDLLISEGTVIDQSLKFAARFTHQSRMSIALMKAIVNRSHELALEEVAALGSEAQAMCYTGDDHRASVDAFLNRQD